MTVESWESSACCRQGPQNCDEQHNGARRPQQWWHTMCTSANAEAPLKLNSAVQSKVTRCCLCLQSLWYHNGEPNVSNSAF